MLFEGKIFSKTLNMETGLTVLIPDNLQGNGSYKAAYLLHGLCGSDGDYVSYTNIRNYCNDHNIIFIMPNGARSFYCNMKYGFNYYDYITKELPEVCLNLFNISSKREDTIIMGCSMGGYGALKCALSRPDLYGYCFAFSSPCLFLKENLDNIRIDENSEEYKEVYKTFGRAIINDFKCVFGENYEYDPQNDVIELAKKINDSDVKPIIYTGCGTNDFFINYNKRYADEMNKLNFDYEFEMWDGAHDWCFFDEAIRRSIERVYK